MRARSLGAKSLGAKSLGPKSLGPMSSPAVHAVSGALLVAAIGVALPVDSARAHEACAGAPGAAAPAGQPWYYRVDRVNHRKCWFTHATTSLREHAAAEPRDTAATPAPSVAAPQEPSAATPPASRVVSAPPQAPADTSDAASAATGTPPAPHVTVLAVKPDPAYTGTISPSPAGAAEPAAEAQMPRDAARNADGPKRGDFMRASRAHSATTPGATGAVPHGLALAQSAAAASAPAPSADLFFVRALAVVMVAALIVLFGMMAGLFRMPRLSRRSDDAWQRLFYERNSPFLVPQESDGPTDLNLRNRINRSPPAPAGPPASRPNGQRPDSRDSMKPVATDIEREPASSGRRAEATATLDRG